MDYKSRSLKFFSKLDIRVLLVFIIIIIFGIFIFIYQFNRHVDCSKVSFIIEAQKKQVGEVIEFYDKTPNAKSWKWDFGDNSPKEFEKSVLHKYTKAGIYTISLQVNGSCTYEKIIEIRDLGKIIDTLKIPKIITPTVVVVGQPVEFYYSYRSEAFAWEWSFGETGQMDNTSEFPVYSYSTPGVKTITLVINGDMPHIASKNIYVKPRQLIKTKKDTIKSYVYEKAPKLFDLPPGNPQKDPLEDLLRNIHGVPVLNPLEKKIKQAEESKAPDISENQFQILLLEVAKQSKTKEDFIQYTCGSYDFPVIKNNNKIMTFAEFCNQLQNKKIKIEALRLTKDNKNCIAGLTITYKVKKAFIWTYD